MRLALCNGGGYAASGGRMAMTINCEQSGRFMTWKPAVFMIRVFRVDAAISFFDGRLIQRILW